MSTILTPTKNAPNGSERLTEANYQALTKDLEATRAKAFAELCTIIERDSPEAYGLFMQADFLAYFEHIQQARRLLPAEIEMARYALRMVKGELIVLNIHPEEEQAMKANLISNGLRP